jgi:hypothetical protein
MGVFGTGMTVHAGNRRLPTLISGGTKLQTTANATDARYENYEGKDGEP